MRAITNIQAAIAGIDKGPNCLKYTQLLFWFLLLVFLTQLTVAVRDSTSPFACTLVPMTLLAISL
jgi:fucose 4-O-acetylase-like acetyltransferase